MELERTDIGSVPRGAGRIGWVILLWIVVLGVVQSCNANGLSREDAFVGYTERNHKHRILPAIEHPRKLEHLIFTTRFGEIKVELQTYLAPKAVNYVKSLVSRGLLNGCSFYRAEPVGPTIDEGRDTIREGYALVQGGLYSCGRQESKMLPIETALNNTKGAVSLITGTSEFFFNLERHPEWDGSFSVWGKVVGSQSWNVLQKIVSLPTRQEAHSSGTILRMLLNAVPYQTRLDVN